MRARRLKIDPLLARIWQSSKELNYNEVSNELHITNDEGRSAVLEFESVSAAPACRRSHGH
jgi:hypothetical protein